MRLRERRRAPSCALIPPQPDRADRVLSALAGALFLVSWVTAYVVVVPPDRMARHGGAQVVAVLDGVRR